MGVSDAIERLTHLLRELDQGLALHWEILAWRFGHTAFIRGHIATRGIGRLHGML